jgi:hypothetical protein
MYLIDGTSIQGINTEVTVPASSSVLLKFSEQDLYLHSLQTFYQEP